MNPVSTQGRHLRNDSGRGSQRNSLMNGSDGLKDSEFLGAPTQGPLLGEGVRARRF
jgi:hypothetical protein